MIMLSFIISISYIHYYYDSILALVLFCLWVVICHFFDLLFVISLFVLLTNDVWGARQKRMRPLRWDAQLQLRHTRRKLCLICRTLLGYRLGFGGLRRVTRILHLGWVLIARGRIDRSHLH